MDKTIILKPRMSEKAYGLSQTTNTFVFDVPAGLNKHNVARAVSAQYEVTVAKVNVVNVKGKSKRTVRKNGRAANGKQNDVRKAYVTLAAGQSLPIFAAIEEETAKAEKTQEAAAKAMEKAEKKGKK
jgi:large subunit ribosomal protein L23